MSPFEGFDFTDFWDDSDYARKAYLCEPPTDVLIAELEQELGYKLPESYIWLMKQHNGGIPHKQCFPTDVPTSWADDHIAIEGIMGIGRNKTYAIGGELGSRFMIEAWEYPDIGVAICDCPSAGHDMIFLDYRQCGPSGEPQVVHIDQEFDYEITPLADNFEAFIRGLVHADVYDTAEEDKAADLEMVRTAAFSPLLAELCAASDNPVMTEQWIRRLCEELVEEKGFFALHSDERSMLLYDIQFWLYTNQKGAVSKEIYLKQYPQMLSLQGPFSTGGYASAFVEDWLQQRLKAGMIIKQNGLLSFTAAAKKDLLAQR